MPGKTRTRCSSTGPADSYVIASSCFPKVDADAVAAGPGGGEVRQPDAGAGRDVKTCCPPLRAAEASLLWSE
ncbi:hypothetical protein Msi02_83650 [Microbispora siamensis]|uniref:Uncharacterized protein n=1 Tax=Microbispora siamensis TaxID=564413 RepID=A0ABQ4H1I2_9ACTN|nr:hypothetical protein Msi02_83650 [Microbispora siamensis]